MVGGKVVFQDGRFPALDERKLAIEAESVCSSSLRALFPAVFDV